MNVPDLSPVLAGAKRRTMSHSSSSARVSPQSLASSMVKLLPVLLRTMPVSVPVPVFLSVNVVVLVVAHDDVAKVVLVRSHLGHRVVAAASTPSPSRLDVC